MALIEQLLQLEVPRTIRISPDNQHVLYSTTTPSANRAGDHGLSTIWLARTGYRDSARQLTSGEFNDHHPRWSPDGQSIAFISDRAKPGSRWAIYTVSAKAQDDPSAITPTKHEQKISQFAFSPDGKTIAYLSDDEKTDEQWRREQEKDDPKVYGQHQPGQRLRLVELATKTITTLVMTSRDSDVVEFAFNDDGTKVAYLHSHDSIETSPHGCGSRVSVVDISTHETQRVAEFRRPLESLQWAGDGLYAISQYDTGTVMGGKAVYTLDVTQPDAKWQLCGHGTEDCPRELSKADRDVTVKVQHGLEDQIRILNGSTLFSGPKAIKAWDASFSIDSDEVILALAQGDINSPAEVYTTTASGGAMVKLSNHGHSLNERQFGVSEFLTCESTDKEVELDAVWTMPFTQAQKEDTATPSAPLPTIVLPHGGPYNRDTNDFNDKYMWVPLLLDAGYAVLQPNYRGGSGRGDAFAAGRQDARGIKDYDDVITLTQHAVELGYADPGKLVIAGWSHGGFLAYLAAVRNGRHGHGWKFKGAIAGAGVTDLDTMRLTSVWEAFEDDETRKAPWDCDKNDVSNRTGSALWEIRDAAKEGIIPKMLILHGKKDPMCPLEQAVGFRRGLERWKVPFEMVVYPREGHRIRERRHIIDMGERVIRFVKECIG